MGCLSWLTVYLNWPFKYVLPGPRKFLTISISGHALYAMTSLMSHNCISNSKTVIRSDYSCECRATTFIPAGEEVTKQVSHDYPGKGSVEEL